MNKTPYKTDPENMLNVYINDELSVPRTIVCAANKFSCGTLVLGTRHWDSIMSDIVDKLGIDDTRDCEQGFVDQYQQFVTREDAMIIVKGNGQPFNAERNGGCNRLLFSEGLY